ncbi:phage head closure protein [Tissierella creatinophila]|uniref:Phage head-tail joining protein n=1 Tax=Tissierella creatinophila DSM 6911 TaxID=1123403 RepID=A0A1U7M6I1_TISCR|nr:phage head closure protein [Tissierella creatinophila]OLS02885.1 phage head-tail joining protein [Tissierella creatinophila DSM 6911]
MKYRHLIEIQKKQNIYDDAGFPKEGYETVRKTYADVNDLYGNEKYLAKQFIQEKVTSFKMRFIEGITPDMFILFQGQRYEIIEHPDNVKYENKELIIKARLVIL